MVAGCGGDGEKLNVTVLAGADDLSSLCEADDAGKTIAGADVIGTKLMLLGVETFSGSFGVSLIGGFTSTGVVLIASVGAFKTEVVVAVLNVTDVMVDRLADGDEATFDFGSSFSFDFLLSDNLLL